MVSPQRVTEGPPREGPQKGFEPPKREKDVVGIISSKGERKISFLEAVLLVTYIGLTDLVGIILVIFGLDDFFILDLFTFPVTQIYFRFKGIDKAQYDLAMNLLELIPYIGALPLRTFGIIMVIREDWRSET